MNSHSSTLNTNDIIVNYFLENDVQQQKPLIFEVSSENSSRNKSPQFICKSLLRIVRKNGRINTFFNHLPNKKMRYLKDLGNTLISIRWRWILLCLFLANAVAYVFFAFAWMGISILNGDLNKNSTNVPCVIGTKHFTGYLLLSIETLTTIGFGFVYPTDCQEGWIIITLQALVGVAIEGALVTAIYVKMSRPIVKDTINLFSKKAVINLRDGSLCLIFRIRDNLGKHRTKTTIKAYFVERRLSAERETLCNYFVPLTLDNFGSLIWPLEVVHKITNRSPLWDTSPENLLTRRFEILVVIEGDSLSTGQTSQSRTSYLNTEIIWGHRFVSCISFDEKHHKYYVDHRKFHKTVSYDTPLCSAKKLNNIVTEMYENCIDQYECSIHINELE